MRRRLNGLFKDVNEHKSPESRPGSPEDNRTYTTRVQEHKSPESESDDENAPFLKAADVRVEFSKSAAAPALVVTAQQTSQGPNPALRYSLKFYKEVFSRAKANAATSPENADLAKQLEKQYGPIIKAAKKHNLSEDLPLEEIYQQLASFGRG